MNNLINFLASLVNFAITLYIYIVIARALLSWFNPNPNNTIVRLIRGLTNPPLLFIQKYVPTFAGLDLSPVILIFAILFLKRIIISLLFSLAVF
jgi:YggT family protein